MTNNCDYLITLIVSYDPPQSAFIGAARSQDEALRYVSMKTGVPVKELRIAENGEVRRCFLHFWMRPMMVTYRIEEWPTVKNMLAEAHISAPCPNTIGLLAKLDYAICTRESGGASYDGVGHCFDEAIAYVGMVCEVDRQKLEWNRETGEVWIAHNSLRRDFSGFYLIENINIASQLGDAAA